MRNHYGEEVAKSCELDTSANPNIATIVGPVVPSVVLLLLLGFLSFRWFRRRRATKEQQGPVPDEEEHKEDKPQLHSDCANRPTFELEGSVPVVVNIDTAATREKSEMAANEPAAHEMPIGKRISRKPASNQVERSTDLTSP
jgi:flagellar biosynthesis/type III secretory pathway M-ring protein FliF/YscJ